MNDKHMVTAENAAKIWGWLQDRGGIAIWKSVNLSNVGASWTTPNEQADGSKTNKPTWQAEDRPSRIITDPAEVVVSTDVEVKRFRVAVRRGSSGLSLKCTDASGRRIHAAVERAGEGAYHVFDYTTQEAVILKPAGEPMPIAEYMAPLGDDLRPGLDGLVNRHTGY